MSLRNYKDPAVIARFWPKVDKRGPEECWEWTASVDNHGYGQFALKVNGRQAAPSAHRVAWALGNSKALPVGKMVCHSCDNPRCCNPAHLWLGTAADNNRDRVQKGRSWNQREKKLYCVKGHPLFGENLKVRKGGDRACRQCQRDRSREWMRASRAARRAM